MPLEPEVKRTTALLDGQNLFYSAKEAFGYSYPNYDPLLLAQSVCERCSWKLDLAMLSLRGKRVILLGCRCQWTTRCLPNRAPRTQSSASRKCFPQATCYELHAALPATRCRFASVDEKGYCRSKKGY